MQLGHFRYLNHKSCASKLNIERKIIKYENQILIIYNMQILFCFLHCTFIRLFNKITLNELQVIENFLKC